MAGPDSNGTTKDVHTLPVVGPDLSGKTEPRHGHGEHGHGGHGGDHVPHVLPLPVYIGTWIALMVLTAVTVAVSYVDLGTTPNLLVALLIATIKATTVALMFMHLRYDKKFHGIIFSFSIIFLAIFIAFTMYDTETRGRTDAVQADRSVNVKAPFKQTKLDGKIEEKQKRDRGIAPGQPMPEVTLQPPR
jgi:cytochrome c oxidase subunit 4